MSTADIQDANDRPVMTDEPERPKYEALYELIAGDFSEYWIGPRTKEEESRQIRHWREMEHLAQRAHAGKVRLTPDMSVQLREYYKLLDGMTETQPIRDSRRYRNQQKHVESATIVDLRRRLEAVIPWVRKYGVSVAGAESSKLKPIGVDVYVDYNDVVSALIPTTINQDEGVADRVRLDILAVHSRNLNLGLIFTLYRHHFDLKIGLPGYYGAEVAMHYVVDRGSIFDLRDMEYHFLNFYLKVIEEETKANSFDEAQ